MYKIFQKLKRSKFRTSFHISEKDLEKIRCQGLQKIRRDAEDILLKNLKVCLNNDGKQTPWKGHPVFTAQHGTATCCRSCLKKWYKIPKEKNLNYEEIIYLSDIIMAWIEKEYNQKRHY